jgi:hypothetical protein
VAAHLPAAPPRRQSLPHPECARCAVLAARLAQRPPDPPADDTIVKICHCCGRTYTLREWYGLDFRGYMAPVVPGFALDVRACTGCTSGLSLPMRLTPAPEVES